ncbi:carboxymuconolactone decarboxylase family protein [Mycoplana rhizolycopersici]|uniref:Carboxymuconolactone decarboxylase family protein n=1 Tax=Mycoplana rhizolycopersici TaxID=2746702 RepID=A0ABX2QAY8_9HYPH|nr:carboxymuconolactone decarboxylase family protein [Rhizobium rhizolycopersici]NVP54893.1 carboxymuconolactone decarboxylase family protein [Rhizobium rhizolycopersici]
MQPRFNFFKASPESYKAVVALEEFVQKSGLERRFIHLIKLRASIINGCAFCVDMHVKESRHDGLSEQWINLMSVWRESPVYDARERALLGWVDAVTDIARTGAPDEAYEALKAHFSEEEMTKITVAIGTINIWNRLAVGFRSQHPIDKPAKAA